MDNRSEQQQKYGIDPVKADDMEKDFLKKRVE